MKHRNRATIICLAGLSFLLPPGSRAGNVLVDVSHLNSYSQFYKISATNAILAQQINDAFQPRTYKVNGLAYGQGYLWGISHLNGFSQIYKINPTNGVLVQQFNDAFQPRTYQVDSLTYGQGYLWGISHLNGYSQIYKIDPASGHLVQQFNDAFKPRFFKVNGLAYGQDYLWGISHLNGYSQIYKIDPANGKVVQQFNDAFQPRTYQVDSLAYGLDCLWGISHLNGYSQLYKIDPANGKLIKQFNDAFQPRATPVDALCYMENAAPNALSLSSSSLPENRPSGAVVGALSTADRDTGDTFTYTLASGEGGTNNASFTISGSTLQSAAPFDHEAKSGYSVRVRTTDQDGLWHEEALTVTVQDVNETPTDIVLSNVNVPENQPSGTEVGTLSASDPDEGNTFTYKMVAGAGSTDNATFSISGSTLRISASPNYEAKNSYSVRVRATDQDGLWNEKTFAIMVDDLNEPAPLFEAPATRPDRTVVLRWSSLANHLYTVQHATNLLTGFTVLQANIRGTPPMNAYTVTVNGAKAKFWKIQTGE